MSAVFWLDTSRPALHYPSPRCHPWQHANRDLLQMWLERNDGAYRSVTGTPS
jgi:predicted metal-dependent hydrolase